jgi:hemerythrin-like domain-containing protein
MSDDSDPTAEREKRPRSEQAERSRAVRPNRGTLPTSFLSLLETHEEVRELFLLHQEALLSLDILLAVERLDECERRLQAHLQAEEELLFPIYRRAARVPGGSVELFVSEHRKMLRFLAQFRDELEALRQPVPNLARRILGLLDTEASFKHLAEHHDLREANILYPTLDRVTSEAECRELLDAISGPR